MSEPKKWGRELKVSELQPKMRVMLHGEGMPFGALVYVRIISDYGVEFAAEGVSAVFVARRTGPDLEAIIDMNDRRLKVFEYLGKA